MRVNETTKPALASSQTEAGPLILQAFAWDMAPDASHWRYLAQHARAIADLGVTIIWLPPAYKGHEGIDDVGYGVYDLYDLGEFDQRGSVPTKYGTRDEYLAAIEALHEAGIAVCADIVLNHRMGADATETVRATPINPQDRHEAIGEPETIEASTRFTFPGRAGAYSDFTWDWTCFHGIDWDEATKRNGLWLFEGKHWNESVDTEFGNFDYLMGCDVHVTEPRVSDELDRWGRWYVETTGVDALRLDAVKHVGSDFYARWLSDLRTSTGRLLPAVGEYWSGDVRELEAYLREVPNAMLFDVPLHYHLHDASISDGNVDLSRLWENTLTASHPDQSVTFVENHDTQPGQSLASTVAPWFKAAAYALILFNEAGVPCVFWGDLLGSPDSDDLPAVRELPILMGIRARAAVGEQHNAFDDADVVGFAREGKEEIPGSGCAVILSDRMASDKTLYVGTRHAGEEWECIIGDHPSVRVADDGTLTGTVSDGGLSVYAPRA